MQALSVVDLRLELLRRALEGEGSGALGDLDILQASVREATERLRHLLFDLESPARRTDLATALQEVASYVLEDSVRWRVEARDDADLPAAPRVIAYRITKEALINVRKHADASQVTVSVRRVEGGVEVVVVDDGQGFDTDGALDQPGHLGLPGMHDRAAVAGGRVAVVSRLGVGTTVRTWLPDSADTPPPTDGHH